MLLKIIQANHKFSITTGRLQIKLNHMQDMIMTMVTENDLQEVPSGSPGAVASPSATCIQILSYKEMSLSVLRKNEQVFIPCNQHM